MDCSDMSMNIGTLFHLSSMPYLTLHSFTLDAAFVEQVETANLRVSCAARYVIVYLLVDPRCQVLCLRATPGTERHIYVL